jgi:hypothetical protein
MNILKHLGHGAAFVTGAMMGGSGDCPADLPIDRDTSSTLQI